MYEKREMPDVLFDREAKIKSEDRFVQHMGHSIEDARMRIQRSTEYMESASGRFADEITLQNLEDEAIYKQGYIDCLVHLLGVNALKLPANPREEDCCAY